MQKSLKLTVFFSRFNGDLCFEILELAYRLLVEMLKTPEGHWVRRGDDFGEDRGNWDLAKCRSRVRGCGKAGQSSSLRLP